MSRRHNDGSVYATEGMSVSSRTAPWIAMATAATEEMTTLEMMRAANLTDWDVRLEPTPSFGRCHFEEFDVVRTNPLDGLPDTLGRVGARYNPFQNEELFIGLGDNLVHGGAHWEAMAAIKNDTVVFGAMSLGADMYIGGDDGIQRHLLLHTSHNGSTNVTASITALRLRCSNAIQVSLKGALQTFKIRHSSTMDGKVAEARRVLGMADVYFDAFSEEMNALINAQVTLDAAQKIVEAAYPKPEKDAKGSMRKWEGKFEDILAIYHAEHNAGIVGTRYGVFNALEERLDWGRTSRTGNEENVFAAASGFDPVIRKEKDRLLDLVRAF